MTDKALARVDTGALLMSGGLDGMMKGAAMLLKSGLLPEQVNTPEKAVVIMLKGQELGIPPMEAMNRINVIKGKPSLSASLMAALVERAMGPSALIVEEAANDHCTVSVWKPGWDKRRTLTYSMDDAKKAGNLSHMYQKYPRAMLRSRAISEACETYFQSIVGGLYTPDELGEYPSEEDVTDERQLDNAGDVREHAAQNPPTPQRSRPSPPPVVAEVKQPEDRGADIEVDRETGEIVGEYVEVDDVMETSEETPQTNDIPGDGPEFFNLVRDLNRVLAQPLPEKVADLHNTPLLKGKNSEQRIVALKKALHANVLQLIEDAGYGADEDRLNEIKEEWGKHRVWTEKVDEKWSDAMATLNEVPV